MQLFFHIGMEKTATTSTQNWFAENRKALQAQAVFYSRVLGKVSHRRLCLWALDPDRQDQGFLYNNVYDELDRARFRVQLQTDFAEEVAQARALGCTTFVISNEHCHSQLISEAEMRRVRQFLEPHFDTIDILCALRPQVDVAVSLASTVSRDRWRVTRAFFDRVTVANPYYNYDALVDRWSSAFGAGRLTLLAFRSWPTAAVYFVDRLGLDQGKLKPIRRFNQALDIRTMAMVNNLRVPIFQDDGRRNPFSNLFLQALPCRETLALGPELAREVQARFAVSNRRLTEARSDISAADLEPDWAKYAAASNLQMLEADCLFSDQIEHLVREFNQRLQIQTLQTHIARTERAIARGNGKNARRFLHQCQQRLQALQQSAEDFEHGDRIFKHLGDLEQQIAALSSDKTQSQNQ